MSLLLSEYLPQPELRTRWTPVARAAVPAIDAHNHYFFWTRTGRRLADLLELMDELNIERMVDIAGIFGEDPYESHALTERKHPDRFITVAALDLADPDDPGFAGRVERAIGRLRDHGFHGLKVWKTLGLKLRDRSGRLVMPDDERLLPVWRSAAGAGLPVIMHLADPAAFFKPLDARNERYEELEANPDWHFYGRDYPGYEDLLAAQERLLARETGTTFILAHVGASAENLEYAGNLLDRYPHVHLDLSARFGELGRQPYTARDFCLRYQDRLLYGLDATPDREAYRLTFRFLETRDEYFPYSPVEPPPQGRWRIYGLNLPPPVLAKIYRENADRLLLRPQRP
ncbi:MAG: amidohydrolase family protein [Bacteroidota bacterium]